MCKLCDKDPESHSFYKLASEGDASIIYSCPGDAKATDKESVIAHITEVLEAQKGKKWIWIVDGKGFGVKQAARVKTSTAIMNLITSTYNDTLLEIRMVNPTKYVVGVFKTIVPFMHPSLKNKIVWKHKS